MHEVSSSWVLFLKIKNLFKSCFNQSLPVLVIYTSGL